MKKSALLTHKARIAVGLGTIAALVIPTAGFALGGTMKILAPPPTETFAFTPAAVDPQLAKRVQDTIRAGGLGLSFTPAGASNLGKRTLTVAIRIDDEAAQAISVRSATAIAGSAPSSAVNARAVTLSPTRFNLGVARGYQSFTTIASSSATLRTEALNEVAIPDLADFKPAPSRAKKPPSRFQPRIALEVAERPGRSPQTLNSLGEQSFDVGGAYRVTKNLDLTAGVRISQDRDRLDPLTNSLQDSQAIYVGTQFRF